MDARIPEIVKQISGQTIIYTEYVEDIIQNISNAVEQAGYTYALFTGSDHIIWFVKRGIRCYRLR